MLHVYFARLHSVCTLLTFVDLAPIDKIATISALIVSGRACLHYKRTQKWQTSQFFVAPPADETKIDTSQASESTSRVLSAYPAYF
jgi:hypothetical protein